MFTKRFSRRLRFEHLEDRRVLSADFNTDNIVDSLDLLTWQDNYGTVETAAQPEGDADDDNDVDGADFLAWQRQFGNISLVAPRNVEARAVGPTSIEVTWEASANATDYLVARRQGTTGGFAVIAPNVVGTSYTDSTGLLSDTLYEYVVVAQLNPSSVPSQVAQATTNQSNLTAHRPQSIYDPQTVISLSTPIYDRFPKRAVREQDETSNTLGPGIRINSDDDNFSGQPDFNETNTPRENDLIEVKVDRLPGQGDLVLTKGSQLSLFFDPNKANPVPLDGGGNTTLPLVFIDNTRTIYVEWSFFGHGTADLRLVDQATTTTLDTVRFHTFNSLIVVFGGKKQKPTDTDGDGSIGDPVGDKGNREGIFDIAQFMYDTGWDVLPFAQQEEIAFTVDLPTTEVLDAKQRLVERHAVIGYSWGGGAAHDLIEKLWSADNDFDGSPDFLITNVGILLDAVQQGLPLPAASWPEQAIYVLNIYQQISVLRGGDINDNDVPPLSTLDEVNTTVDAGWDHTLNHFSIDDDLQVGQLIVTQLFQHLITR